MTSQTREKLVRRGVELLTESSLESMGLDAMLKSIGITKGSFYHFFGSKRDFTVEVIDWYAAYFEDRFQRIFGDTAMTPIQRLEHWILTSRHGMARHGFKRGCLVGNLSQELGANDALISERLRRVFQDWEGWVQRLLDDAVIAGELDRGVDTRQLARVFWMGWHGAILRAKLEREAGPLEDFATFFLALVASSTPARGRRA